MPMIDIKVSVPISKETEERLKVQLGQGHCLVAWKKRAVADAWV